MPRRFSNLIFVEDPGGRNELRGSHRSPIPIPGLFRNRHLVRIKPETFRDVQKRNGVARIFHIHPPIPRSYVLTEIGLFRDDAEDKRGTHASLLRRNDGVLVCLLERNSGASAQGEQFRTYLGDALFFIRNDLLIRRLNALGGCKNPFQFGLLLLKPFFLQLLDPPKSHLFIRFFF